MGRVFDGIDEHMREWLHCQRMFLVATAPLHRYEGQRDQLGAWAARRGDDGLRAYRAESNSQSLDGLPGLAKEDT